MKPIDPAWRRATRPSRCRRLNPDPLDRWPDDMPVPTFGPRMVCTRCGIIGADARPNWKEQCNRGAFGSVFNPMPPLSIAVATGHD
jgi:hypothetical protein